MDYLLHKGPIIHFVPVGTSPGRSGLIYGSKINYLDLFLSAVGKVGYFIDIIWLQQKILIVVVCLLICRHNPLQNNSKCKFTKQENFFSSWKRIEIYSPLSQECCNNFYQFLFPELSRDILPWLLKCKSSYWSRLALERSWEVPLLYLSKQNSWEHVKIDK